uniref:Protein deadpan n=2 Tax=Ascaris TaxID=6251 RepID=F1L6X0_ASCSU
MSPQISTKIMPSPYPSPSPPQLPLERKLKKPLMEKRRRARMNDCLDQLKQLLLHIAPHQRSKLEKADILEMTVAYLQQLHQQRTMSPPNTIAGTAIYRQSYIDGFSMASAACVDYVRTVFTGDDATPYCQQLGVDLLQHLQSLLCAQLRVIPTDGGSPINDAHTRMGHAIRMSHLPLVHPSPPSTKSYRRSSPHDLPANECEYPRLAYTSPDVITAAKAVADAHTRVISAATTAEQISDQRAQQASSVPLSFSSDVSLQLSPISGSSLDETIQSSFISTSGRDALYTCTSSQKGEGRRLWRPF